jgi:hypothetical protein
MANSNTITITITDDGRVIVQTSAIGSKDHLLAERMLSELPQVLGAEETKLQKLQQHHYHHHHHHQSHDH